MIFAQSYKNLSYLQKKKENFFSFIPNFRNTII